jgi:general secretion pathway protein G
MIFIRNRGRVHSDGGFTLIEILVVLVVLGIMSAVAVVALSSFNGTSPAASCRSDYQSVQTAMDSYRQQEGTFPIAGQKGIPPTVGSTANAVTYLMQQDNSVPPAGPWMNQNQLSLSGHYQIWAPTDGSGTISVYNSAGTLVTGGTGGTVADCALVK